jgi:excisionase family DNA binding protein
MTTNRDQLPLVPPAKPAYTVDEVADLLGLHRVTVSGFISRGELRAARLGHRTVRITYEALVDFLRSKEVVIDPDKKSERKDRGKKS